MKSAATAATSLLLALALLPVVLAGGDPQPPALCGIGAGPIETILATIRTVESGGDYTARATGSSASGAYQFIDATWSGYGGHQHAADAPPPIQDAKATEHVNNILDGHHNDVTAVPVVWYIGHLPAPGDTEWDAIPMPDAGNELTPRQYQTKWMTIYNDLLAAAPPATTQPTVPTTTTSVPSEAPGGCVGGGIAPITDDWALPGPRELLTDEAIRQPHHDYAAWDWLIPENTPIYNIQTGTVVAVHTWPHNWWTAGCGAAGGNGCDTCGVGLTISDSDKVRWTYCHGNNLTTTLGDHVPAGRQILWSGNTGRSGAPHVHIEIRVNDVRRCPQPLIAALHGGATLHVSALPSSGCSF